MGCGSQNGCLGPKPRQRQVYLDLVETIHNQARTINLPSNEDPYAIIKGHLTKKGLLRKLIDNLISHKSHLDLCSNKILQIASTTHNQSEHIASLIVVDKIIDQFFKEQAQPELKQKQSKKSAPQSLPDIVPLSLPSLPSYNQLSVDIYHRVNASYFKIIIVLLEKEGQLYKNVLSSLSNFLNFKNDKILCKTEVFRIFELLIEKIKQNGLVQESAQVFALLLSRIKENFFKEVHNDYISFFVRNWFFKSDKQSSLIVKSFQNVLKQLLNKFFGHTQIIILSFITVLDDVYFEKGWALKIQDFLLNASQNQQIGKQLIRTMAVYLLKYLQIGQESNEASNSKFRHCQDHKCKLNGFRLLTKWILENYVNINSIIEYNPSTIITAFVVNIEGGHSSAFQTQLKAQFFKIISSVNQQSIITLTNLLAEEIRQKHITNIKREIFFSLFQQILRQKSQLLSDQKFSTKIRFILNLQRYYTKQIKVQLFNLATRSIRSLNIMKIKIISQANQIFRERICKFLYSIFDIIVSAFDRNDSPSEENSHQEDQRSKKLKKLSNLHKFILEVLKLIKCFSDYHLYSYLLAFLDSISYYLNDIDPKEDQKQAIILFFLTFIIQYTLFVMNKKQRMSQPISKLTLKLEKQNLTHQHFTQIVDSAKEMIKKQEQTSVMIEQFHNPSSPRKPQKKTKFLISKLQKKIVATRQLFMIQSIDWKEIVSLFKENFRYPLKQGKKIMESQNYAEKEFKRIPSINFGLDQSLNEKNSTRYEGQQSFRQIIQKIQQQ